MQKQLDDHERKLVIIIDPHIKNVNSYAVVEDLKYMSLGVNDKNNKLSKAGAGPVLSTGSITSTPQPLTGGHTLHLQIIQMHCP